ncbi:hypothetical protein LDENG_00250870, partial [Lucifuga dentata]
QQTDCHFNFYIKSGTVVQWLALLPHSKKVLGSIPAKAGPFCVEFACSPPCLRGFPPGAPASSHLQRHACQVNWKL